MAPDIRKTQTPDLLERETGSEPSFQSSDSQPRLSRQVQAELGQRLRVFYETLKLGEQPVPDRFIELINRLDHAPEEKRL
jgi:hypothetical protein